MFSTSCTSTTRTRTTSPITRAAFDAIQNMPLAPPAYTTTADHSLDLATLDPELDSETDETDVSEWNEPPVTVHINASITIEGTSNQVALPPHPSARPLLLTGDNLRAVQGSGLDYTTHLSPFADRLASDRAEQISEAVMQALKDSGVLAGTVTPMRRLDVSVDASVTVKGEKNVLTTIVPLKRNVTTGGATGTTPPETPNNSTPLDAADRLAPEGVSEPSVHTHTQDEIQIEANAEPLQAPLQELMPRSSKMENAQSSNPGSARLSKKRLGGEQGEMRTVKRKRTVM